MKRLLILFLIFVACSQAPAPTNLSTSPDSELVLRIQDHHADPLPGIQRLSISISQIHLHSETGWQTLTQNAKRYELIQLRKVPEAQTIYTTSLPPQHYDQLKLYLTQASLTQKNRNQDIYLAGHELSIPLNLDAKAGHTYTVQLDLNTAESLFSAKYNEYVMAPQLEVEIQDQDTLLEKYNLGMDEHGNVEKNNRISSQTEFRIVNNKIQVIQPLLRDSNAGVNVYLQSVGTHKPIQLILKEIRLQNNNTVTIYKGEQELLLDRNQVQEITSEQVPSDQYDQIKFYFEDTGRGEQGEAIELVTPIFMAPANLSVLEDETLNILVQLEVQEQGNRYSLKPSLYTSTEKSIRTDASRTGQRLYIPNADLNTIREADQGLFLN